MAGFDDVLELLLREEIDPRGKLFERLTQWYLLNDPAYKRQLSRVWLWNEWPGRWGPDAGIDLVAETKDGKLWAIQSKVYNPKYTVTKKDVDSFLSESGRQIFNYRLLMMTTNHLSAAGQRVIKAQQISVGVLDLFRLQQAEIRWPRSLRTLNAKPAQPMKPRPHQKRAINDVTKGLNKEERGQLIMACGTGKTLTALWIAEKMKSNRTLILVPSLSLLSQTLRSWTASASKEFDFLPVCSDSTVAESDQMVANVSELGFPATTTPADVTAFLRKRGPRVVFSTYQSSPVIMKALAKGRTPGFDLAIADEAHRCAGAVSSDFATILDAQAIRAKRRLFMTATPRYFTGRIRKEAAEADFEIASMDDESNFGKILHRLKFSEAIEKDLLTDYQIAIVGVDEQMYRGYAQKGKFVTTDGKKITDARSLATKIALAKATRRYNLRRVISFHSRVDQANDFSRRYPEVVEWMPPGERPSGKLWTNYVSGAMAAGKRDNLLGQFSGLGDKQRGVLSNARCLGEGVDIPALDGVVFVDPRKSQVDIVQAVGRAIRKSDRKTIGTIVLPVFLTDTEDAEVALDQSEFKPIWDVLKALRSHDDELAEELDSLRRELGRRGSEGIRSPGKIRFDMPKSVGASFVHAIEVRLVEQSTESWEFLFGLLEKYVQERANAQVPTEHKQAGVGLGLWVSRQRHSKRMNLLSEERSRRLESLQGWAWNRQEALWEENFAALKKYAQDHGDARVPFDFNQNGLMLGFWVANQRAKRAKLSPDRVRRLESVNNWVWEKVAAQWEDGFSALKKYAKDHGDARVPSGLKQDGYQLGDWVVTQRVARAKGKLGADRIRRLESMQGWVWNTKEASWEEGFAALQKYVKMHGDALVPSSFKQEGASLGSWVGTQRTHRNKGKLSAERIRRLESMQGWVWNSKEATWEEGFAALEKFVKKHGHARVPQSFKQDGYGLGTWVSSQRNSKRFGRLSSAKARRLGALKGWVWDVREALWEEGFAALQVSVKKHGNSQILKHVKQDGYQLGSWVVTQRVARAKGKLGADRIRRLESMQGWVWNTKEANWEEGFAALQKYGKKHRDALVPSNFKQDGYPLGNWVVNQRAFKRRGQLSRDRVRRLESVNGWVWNTLDAAWEDGFSALKQYVKKHGDARVPFGFNQNGLRLGNWVQRQRYRRGSMSKERTRRLESVKGWVWDARS